MAKITPKSTIEPRYRVLPDGTLETAPYGRVIFGEWYDRDSPQARARKDDEIRKMYPIADKADAVALSMDIKNKAIIADFNKKLIDVTNQENTKNAIAKQISELTAGGGYQGAGNMMYSGGTPRFNESTGRYNYQTIGGQYGPLGGARTYQEAGIPVEQQKILNDYTKKMISDPSMGFPNGTTLDEKTGEILYPKGFFGNQQNNPLNNFSSQNIYGSTDLASKLNFQVSDDQIINDYNKSKLGQLNSIVSSGNAQIAGIQERLNAAQTLLNQLPSGDARRVSSEVYVNQLKSDLASVQSAVTDATNQIKDFKPITAGSPEAASQITSFREYLQLPEERATQQLRQIDPESYKTAVALGQRYRQMATQPIGPTTTQQTEQLRSQLEQEAINQLQLGSQLGAEEQRQYQQAARAAQTARGNVFGVAPAVEEAVTTGAAGEQRKLARYGAAAQFLGSGQTTSDALRADLAFRDALLQNRLGAASGFIAGGPSLYNLGQARTGAQQSAFQNYIQANQALPGQFGQAPSTAQPFYQVTQPGTPVDLTQTFANLYGSVANYQAKTYGDYVGAQASTYRSPAQTFGDIAGGLSNLIRI